MGIGLFIFVLIIYIINLSIYLFLLYIGIYTTHIIHIMQKVIQKATNEYKYE